MSIPVFRDVHQLPESFRQAVVAIGNFDGVHKGHQAVIAHAKAIATRENRPLLVLTFEPHPRRVFNPALPALKLCRFSEKARLLAAYGVDAVVVQRFTRAFAATAAEDFIETILIQAMGARAVVTGDNFTFGHGRRGTPEMLRQYSPARFVYSAMEAVGNSKTIYGSSAIRTALTEGNVTNAAAMLGRHYSITGRVMRGDGRGRTLGYPTANIALAGLFLPKFGVYAVRVRIGENVFSGVANLGIRPTFGGEVPRLEVHVFDFSQSLYGQKIQVELIEFLRPEQKFDSVETLKTQLATDAVNAKRVASG